MPPRLNILEDFISAIEGLVPQAERPARAPMRTPAPAGGGGPDLEAARRLAGPARASQAGEEAVSAATRPERTQALRRTLETPESRAAITGHAAIAQEFESLIRQAQANPEVRFRGELRPDIRSQPPAPPQPPTGLQNAPLSTQQLQSVIQRTGRQAQARLSNEEVGRKLQSAQRPPSPATPPNRLPTPAQTTIPGRQALTPSQASQPQTARTAAPARPVNWEEPATRQFFDTHIRKPLGMNPQQFEQYYFAGYVRNPRVYASSGQLQLTGDIRAPTDMVARNARGEETRVPAGTYLGTINRQIMPGSRSVYNALFALDQQYQGMGIAKQIFRNQIDVYRRMGNIDTVKVSAAKSGGGHSWARFGFVPDARDWISNRREMLSRLRATQNLTPEHRALAERIINSDNPIYARALAAMPMAEGAREGMLGRKLMAGTHWRGTLDLRNPRDMNYFDAYVGPAAAQQ